jgi:hypothetical protein
MKNRTLFALTPCRPKLSENDVEKACKDLLRLRGYYVTRLHAGTFKTVDGKRWIKGVEKGVPDYETCHRLYPGFLLEVKRPGESPQPEQALRIMEIRLGYHLAIAVVDDVRALNQWLDNHEREARERWRALLNTAK